MADINIHTNGNMRLAAFFPSNDMSIRFVIDGDDVTFFGIDAARAWALFDMFREGDTAFHYCDESIYRIGDNPERAAELVARARAATLEIEEAA